MANELILNVTLGEARVARLENGVVSELYIERTREQGVVGNVYKGKVVRVLPGMQAAFVEIGLDRTAFLHAHDVVQEMTRFEADIDDEEVDEKERPRRFSHRPRKIEDLLKEGKDILVQVEKEPMGTKGARLTSHISLPGRYLVYMPTVNHIGISRRLGDQKERKRLRSLIESARPKGSGFIIRTACIGISDEEITADMQYLIRTWNEIEQKAAKAQSPAVVHAELDVLLRVVRDLFTSDINRLVIDNKEGHDRIREFVKNFMPGLKSTIQLYEGHEPIFDHYGIEIEITRALGQKVWLKSGGYIIIEQTEALTAIDVNTGRFVGRRNLDDTILKTNLEAVKEIVYQLRLRSIGGIIILDFIDMERMSDRQKVFNSLKEALKSDRARTTITKISDLGLVEMTRKRTREDLRRQLTDPCTYCEGKGYLKSPTTVCYEVFREIQREAQDSKGKQMVVFVHPQVANILYDEERRWLEILEERYKKRISVKTVAEYHMEQFDVAEG
ncbi:MAG: Rne/Rng family ribonuclease [Deltaproteobacteria bacterium]|nr:Rne/Rng family ribonuclease [Deltaproteobacteria bacterium]MDZ4225046.1 Rne/Rng family ribonuclease [bacterium]